ncbi:MAG: PEP-CTERM sorting domain-containing protein [Akkermansia sp.]|nr:PEP-CTERM sorting domain-containing protein [Akkermansia sp.]
MKKTLIILTTLIGVVATSEGFTDSAVSANQTLTSDTTYADDYRILVAGSDKAEGNSDGSVVINVSGPVTIASINGNGLNNVNSVTYNLTEAFTVTGELKPTTNADCVHTLNLGNTGSFNGNPNGTLTFNYCASLTINAGLADVTGTHTLMSADYININFLNSDWLTLNITTPEGYKEGGLIFYCANSDAYYSASDMVKTTDGSYFKPKANAQSLTLFNDTVYTVARMNSTIQQNGSVKNLSLKVGTAPEPTTATLSLLALAGLAARRRRR